MKILYMFLALAVFAVGTGIGGLIALNVPVADLFSVESYSTTSRGLNFQSVQAADSDDDAPLTARVQAPGEDGPVERNSPADWIKESQIEMRPDGVFIHLNNPQWAILADTNSMDPVFDSGSHLIQAFPTAPSDIRVGDIISYDSPLGFSIVHRVTEIGNDDEGWYAITKGDNNPTPDPWKIRFDWVTRVTVMIVY